MRRSSAPPRLTLIIILLALLLIAKGIRSCYSLISGKPDLSKVAPSDSRTEWRTHQLVYTKHARCRMDCRNISENEVEDIQHNGSINYRKSDLHDEPCASYAVEGTTHDGQQVRIVFGACQKITTVITCIDLGTEHVCDCK